MHFKKGECVTVVTVAERYNVSRNTVYAWVKDGLLPHIRLPSGQIRIRQEDLAEFERTMERAGRRRRVEKIVAPKPEPKRPEKPRKRCRHGASPAEAARFLREKRGRK